MQSYAQQRCAAGKDTILAYKRHILLKSAGFAAGPMEDLFRVNLLSQMLDRHDELAAKGMSEYSCRSRVLHEYADIAAQMRDQGFEEDAEPDVHSRWPQLTQAEAERYIKERDAYLHKTSMGVMLCTACVAPLMIGAAFDELLYSDAFALLGLIGMFAMIGMGIYAMVTAGKPKDEKKIRKGRFSLSRALRSRLEGMRDAAAAKARRRKGRGIVSIVMSLTPVLIGVVLSEVSYTDAWPMFGMVGMFGMIAMGVYELVMADGEKKTIGRLLNHQEE